MLTGRRLFEGETLSDVIAAVLTREPDLSAVSPPWRRRIGRCLEKDPRKRLRDVGDGWLQLDHDDLASGLAPRARARRVWPWALGTLVAGLLAIWGGDRVHGTHAAAFFVNGGTVMAAEFSGLGDRPVGAPRALFTFAGAGGIHGFGRSYAVTPDGQRFVAIVSVPDTTPHPATVILNWRATLR